MYGDFAVSSPSSAIRISVTVSRETKRRPANSAERKGGRKLSPPAAYTWDVKVGKWYTYKNISFEDGKLFSTKGLP